MMQKKKQSRLEFCLHGEIWFPSAITVIVVVILFSQVIIKFFCNNSDIRMAVLWNSFL
jgi:hypothetical protein